MYLAKFNKLLNIFRNVFFLKVLFHFGVPASTEHDSLLKSLSNKSLHCIVDVGANRGQFSLVARHHFPGAAIYSFEPLKEPATIYQKIFADDQKIKLYKMAIGSTEKETIIHVSKADDSSSLLPISNLQNELYPGTSEKETRTVIEKPLDAILSASDIQTPAFLKIDVQGFEKSVLEGCESLLPLFSYVYVECSFVELYSGQALADEIISFLMDFGFKLKGVYNLSYDKHGIAIQGDFLFVR